MVTKATISYIDSNKTQNCVTGSIMKSTKDMMVIHPENSLDSALRLDKRQMEGKILESDCSDIQNIGIIEYNKWTFDSEIYFLLPNKSLNNENEIIISGLFNSKKIISGNKITIETDDTLFKLNYHQETSSWQLDKDFVVSGKLYDFDVYKNNTYCTDIFYIRTNDCIIRDLGVNSERI